MQAAEEPLNPRNSLNQRERKQGNINPLVCAQRFCASAKIFRGLNNCYCIRWHRNAVLFKEFEMKEEWRCTGAFDALEPVQPMN